RPVEDSAGGPEGGRSAAGHRGRDPGGRTDRHRAGAGNEGEGRPEEGAAVQRGRQPGDARRPAEDPERQADADPAVDGRAAGRQVPPAAVRRGHAGAGVAAGGAGTLAGEGAGEGPGEEARPGKEARPGEAPREGPDRVNEGGDEAMKYLLSVLS